MRRPHEDEEQVEGRGDRPLRPAHRWIRSLNMLVGLATLMVEGLLGLRLAFQLTGADAGNEFVNSTYDPTGWLVGPFQGISEEREALGGFLEPATPITMGIYLAAALMAMAALGPSPWGCRRRLPPAPYAAVGSCSPATARPRSIPCPKSDRQTVTQGVGLGVG